MKLLAVLLVIALLGCRGQPKPERSVNVSAIAHGDGTSAVVVSGGGESTVCVNGECAKYKNGVIVKRWRNNKTNQKENNAH